MTESMFMFQVCIKRYLPGIWVLLHLTGKCVSGHLVFALQSNTVLQTINRLNVLYKIFPSPALTYIGVFCMCPACVAGLTGRCSLFGRHHVHTFDGVLYEFPGDCSYLLAGDCNHRSFTLLGESHSDSSIKKQTHFNSNAVYCNALLVQLNGLCIVTSRGLSLSGMCVLKLYVLMFLYWKSAVYETFLLA